MASDQQIEQKIVDRGLIAPRVTLQDLEAAVTDETTVTQVPEEYETMPGVWVGVDLVRRFILRTNNHILDIDSINVVKMLNGQNYEYVTNDRFIVLFKGE